MGRTEIDLTKCNNCLFRAVYNCRPVSGTVKVGEEWCNLNFYGGIVSVRVSGLLEDSGIADFEIVSRAPETYKDWQVGDKVFRTDTRRVIFRSGDFVAVDSDGRCVCYTVDELFHKGYRLVLTDIEQQIIEERKKSEWKPQDGDIIAFGYKAIGIFRNFEQSGFHSDYVTLSLDNLFFNEDGWVFDKLRPATEEEKQRLFDAMAKEGKRWNAEKKVVEDIPKPYEFKKGEPVLVRIFYDKTWGVGLYDAESNNVDMPYWVYVGYKKSCYSECIPLNERTMHLLGTTEDYREEQL